MRYVDMIGPGAGVHIPSSHKNAGDKRRGRAGHLNLWAVTFKRPRGPLVYRKLDIYD